MGAVHTPRTALVLYQAGRTECLSCYREVWPGRGTGREGVKQILYCNYEQVIAKTLKPYN